MSNDTTVMLSFKVKCKCTFIDGYFLILSFLSHKKPVVNQAQSINRTAPVKLERNAHFERCIGY